MPRKKLLYTHEFPYHVWARSNNKEWFYLPPCETWKVFENELNNCVLKFELMVHAFVMMSNHYHLICTTHPNFNLGVVMQHLQKSVSRNVNRLSGRINHVFGGPYKASLIQDQAYYYTVLKYLYRNPIEAGVCRKVENYPYSTLSPNSGIITSSPLSGMMSLAPHEDELATWINVPEDQNYTSAVKRGLAKTIFTPVYSRDY